MDSKSSFDPLSSIVFILLLFPMSVLYHLFRPQRAGELLVAEAESGVVVDEPDVLHSTSRAPLLFQVHAHSYFAIFQQSQADNVLESKIVPPRMASSTSASERTTG